MVTGSKSNVHPSLYGGDASEANGPYDPARDATTLPLIRKAIERGVPLLAICRGIQELNVALGGTLATEIQEREGSLDHRAPVSDNQDERFAIRQNVSIKPGSCLAGVFGAGDIMVNSVHRQAVDRLGPKLQVEAVAEDGTVEAVSVRDSPRLRRRRAMASRILGEVGRRLGAAFSAPSAMPRARMRRPNPASARRPNSSIQLVAGDQRHQRLRGSTRFIGDAIGKRKYHRCRLAVHAGQRDRSIGGLQPEPHLRQAGQHVVAGLRDDDAGLQRHRRAASFSTVQPAASPLACS